MTAPIFGTRMVPAPIRMLIGVSLAAMVGSNLEVANVIDPLSFHGSMVTCQQVIIGAAMGLTLRMIFMVFEIGGQIMAQQMGLGFAAMVDPQSGNQVPVISQFYVVLATFMFLTLNGHLVLISALVSSFEAIPVGGGAISRESMSIFLTWTGQLIAESLRLALPVLAALLVVNTGFGVMSRAAPQLNIFVIGFPAMMIAGISMMIVTLPMFNQFFDAIFRDAIDTLYRLLVP